MAKQSRRSSAQITTVSNRTARQSGAGSESKRRPKRADSRSAKVSSSEGEKRAANSQAMTGLEVLGEDADALDTLPLHLRLCRRLKEARRKLGWTLEQASGSSEVSRSMISQIERGLANPTLAVAYRLATAYGLSLGELVDPPGIKPKINVVRGDDRRSLFRNDKQCCVRTLSPLSLEKDVEFYEVTIHAGQRMSSSPHFRETREFVTVERGSLEVVSGGESIRLEAGDSAQYPADVPHELVNPGKGETVAFLVVIYPVS